MFKREIYLSRIRGFYNSDLVKILVGIRRCGKSVILNQIMEEIRQAGVDSEHIIYILIPDTFDIALEGVGL